MTSLWFVTPVYRRFHLTRICLEQRRRLLEALPFEARQVIIGDDENLDVARDLGFDIVEKDNKYVASKFNAGYRYACENGATHCMPIGSDSWLHPSTFEGEDFEGKDARGIVGLSSFSPDGQERADLEIRYPAGFGVGMIYPAYALMAKNLRGEPAQPFIQRGIDNSTWDRVGRGKLRITFMEPRHWTYINFHSTEDSITDFRLLQRSQKRVRVYAEDEDAFGPLRSLYDADLIEQMETYYALRALQVFLTGEHPVFSNPHQRKRTYPRIEQRPPQSGGKKLAGVASRYPQIDARGRPKGKTEFEKREYRALMKRRGLTLTRDEEIAYRFDQAREA